MQMAFELSIFSGDIVQLWRCARESVWWGCMSGAWQAPPTDTPQSPLSKPNLAA
jgi:hypothetical protein